MADRATRPPIQAKHLDAGYGHVIEALRSSAPIDPSSTTDGRSIARSTDGSPPSISSGVKQAPDIRQALARAAKEPGVAPPRPLRDRVEAATGTDLHDVRIHAGPSSHEAATWLHARAYTVGRDVHFAAGQLRQGDEGDRLLAHELIHTLQPGPTGPAAMQPKLEVSEPGDASEVEADRLADAIVGHNGPVPVPRQATPGAARKAIARAEFKSGAGTFKVAPYTESDADNGKNTARQVGVDIDITFHPNDALRSDKIDFVQTMLTKKDEAPYLFENEKPRATEAKQGEAGWVIDRLAGQKSPVYNQDNTGGAGGNTIFGHRTSKTDYKDAWMHDGMALNRAVGQKVTVDAVTFALDETHSKYLGGVSWGFVTDTAGKTKKNVAALKSSGDPGGTQKEALKKWNEQADLADTSKRNAPDQEKVPVP